MAGSWGTRCSSVVLGVPMIIAVSRVYPALRKRTRMAGSKGAPRVPLGQERHGQILADSHRTTDIHLPSDGGSVLLEVLMAASLFAVVILAAASGTMASTV